MNPYIDESEYTKFYWIVKIFFTREGSVTLIRIHDIPELRDRKVCNRIL